VDVIAAAVELLAIEDEVVGETRLPEPSLHVACKAALDVLHGFWKVLGLDK